MMPECSVVSTTSSNVAASKLNTAEPSLAQRAAELHRALLAQLSAALRLAQCAAERGALKSDQRDD